jgi:Rieske 2Fe-2S family protein
MDETRAGGHGADAGGLTGITAADLEATLQPLERATMLPPAAFRDPAVLGWELGNVFAKGWICVGHASALAEPGAFVRRDVGAESFFVVAGEDGVARAFHNVCRHRGAQIVEQAEGQVRRRLRCPYHAWSYDLEGNLQAAPHMDEVEDFDHSCFGLREIRTAVVGGLVLVDLDGEAEPAEDHVGELLSHLDHYSVAALQRGGQLEYEVAANWKGIAENYNECLHCPGVHPELNALSDYMSGEGLYGVGAWCGGSMTLNEGAETMGKEGGHGVRPPIATLAESDLRNILYFALFPNALISLHPDYAMLHTLWPREPGRTDVVCEFFFEPATIAEPGFDPGDAIRFWDQTNRQDWHVCELAQKGVASSAYIAGRYSIEETDVHAFDTMVAARYREGLREDVVA